MGVDANYGKVTTERGGIAPGEPVVLLRAGDPLLVDLLALYADLAYGRGAPPEAVQAVRRTRARIINWQLHNRTTPVSELSWAGGE